MFNPCSCGNPLADATVYQLKDYPELKVRAKKMDRDFLAKGVNGVFESGKAGEYLVESLTTLTGRQFVFDSTLFEEQYEPVKETSSTS